MGKVYNLSNYDLNLRRQFVNSDRPGLNEFLHYLYRLVFNEIATSAKVLEIGAGAGISKKFQGETNVFRTDLFEFPESEVKGGVDSHQLPFQDKDFEFCMAIDVLHHLEFPLATLKELKRVTNFENAGKIVFIEPYVSFFSYPIYRIFHDEKTSNPWFRNYSEPFISSKPEDGDQALSRLLFTQKNGVNQITNLFPEGKYQIQVRVFSILSFFVTGGLNKPLPIPRLLVKVIIFLENLIPQHIMRYLGSRCLIVIENVK